MSKTVITSTGNQLDSIFDRRFGRSAWFCIYDQNTNICLFQKNKHIDAAQDAGIKVAQVMIEMDIKKVISGDFGPKAEELLDEQLIQMVILTDEHVTIREIINRLKK